MVYFGHALILKNHAYAHNEDIDMKVYLKSCVFNPAGVATFIGVVLVTVNEFWKIYDETNVFHSFGDWLILTNATKSFIMLFTVGGLHSFTIFAYNSGLSITGSTRLQFSKAALALYMITNVIVNPALASFLSRLFLRTDLEGVAMRHLLTVNCMLPPSYSLILLTLNSGVDFTSVHLHTTLWSLIALSVYYSFITVLI